MDIKSIKSLTRWNYAAAAVHLAATIASAVYLQSKSTVQMVRLKYDAADPDINDRSRVDIPVNIEDDAIVDLRFIVVSFFAITFIAHLLYATDFFGKGWYSSHILGFGWNPYRWVEYSLSASLMIYLISATSGTKDQVTAISAALITPGLMINGFTTERALKQNAIRDWTLGTAQQPIIDKEIVLSNLIPAWFLFAVHWYIILSNYAKLIKEAREAGRELDSSVTFMVFSQLIFFSVFGAIQTIQVLRWLTSRQGRIEPNFIVYEEAYIVLSAITKLFLAGTVAYALRG